MVVKTFSDFQVVSDELSDVLMLFGLEQDFLEMKKFSVVFV